MFITQYGIFIGIENIVNNLTLWMLALKLYNAIKTHIFYYDLNNINNDI